MMHKSLTVLLMVSLMILPVVSSAVSPQVHEQQIGEWRQSRHDRLASDNGWMTLVGLEWLQEGENRVGSSSDSTAKIPGGPADWGSIYLAGDELRFVPAAGSGVLVDGSEVSETVLVADSQGTPTLVSHGNLSFYVIFRESYGLRIKDTQAPALLDFTGVPSYDMTGDTRPAS